MLYVLVLKLMFCIRNTREDAMMSHFVDKSNGEIFFVRTFLFLKNKRLSRINTPLKDVKI